MSHDIKSFLIRLRRADVHDPDQMDEIRQEASVELHRLRDALFDIANVMRNHRGASCYEQVLRCVLRARYELGQLS